VPLELARAKGDVSLERSKGEKLLTHMVDYQRRTTDVDVVTTPSPYLDVEVSSENSAVLQPNCRDGIAGHVMKLASGFVAKNARAKRKLAADVGAMGHCVRRRERPEAHQEAESDLQPGRVPRRPRSRDARQWRRRKESGRSRTRSRSSAPRRSRSERSRNRRTRRRWQNSGAAALRKLVARGGTVAGKGITRADLRAVAAKFFDEIVPLKAKSVVEARVGELLAAKPELLAQYAAGDGEDSGGGGDAEEEEEDEEEEEEDEEEEEEEGEDADNDDDDGAGMSIFETAHLERVGSKVRDCSDGEVFRCVGVSKEDIEYEDEDGETVKMTGEACFLFVDSDSSRFDGSLVGFSFDMDDDGHSYTPASEVLTTRNAAGDGLLFEWL